MARTGDEKYYNIDIRNPHSKTANCRRWLMAIKYGMVLLKCGLAD